MITKPVLQCFNDNTIIKTISHLIDDLTKLRVMLSEIDHKTDTDRISLFLQCYSEIFDVLDQKIIHYKVSRIVKPFFVTEPEILGIWNSDLSLSLTIDPDVETVDDKFYGGTLKLLVRYYHSCFKKINSYLLVPNRMILAKVEGLIDEKIVELNCWLDSVYDRTVISQKEQLKENIVAKLPFGSFTYAASINNVQSILKHGILSHNAVKLLSVLHTDISNTSVNEYRAYPNRFLQNRPAHDYVNMHINPENSIIYHFIANAGGKDKLVFFKINPNILVQKDGYFSKGNVAKAVYNQHTSGISNDLQEFEKLNWEILSMANPKNNLYEERKAEVLIYNNVNQMYIDEIVVYDVQNLLALMPFYPNHLGIKLTLSPSFFDKIR